MSEIKFQDKQNTQYNAVQSKKSSASAWLMKKGIAKTERSAAGILLFIFAFLLIVSIVIITSGQGDDDLERTPPENVNPNEDF